MHSPEQPITKQPPQIPEGIIPLILSPRHRNDDNTPVSRGIDLYARALPGSGHHYLVWEWSLLPGEEDRFVPVPEEFAVFFVQEMCNRLGPVAGIDHERIIKFLPRLYDAER